MTDIISDTELLDYVNGVLDLNPNANPKAIVATSLVSAKAKLGKTESEFLDDVIAETQGLQSSAAPNLTDSVTLPTGANVQFSSLVADKNIVGCIYDGAELYCLVDGVDGGDPITLGDSWIANMRQQIAIQRIVTAIIAVL